MGKSRTIRYVCDRCLTERVLGAIEEERQALDDAPVLPEGWLMSKGSLLCPACSPLFDPQ